MPFKIKRPTKIVELVLDGDLAAEHEKAEQALTEAKRLDLMDAREIPRANEAAAAVIALEERMSAGAVRFTLEGLSSRRWAEEVAARQLATKDKPGELQIDRDTFDPLITASIVKVENPDGSPADFKVSEFPALADDMTNGQYQKFVLAVTSLNTGWPEDASGVPFSGSASLTMLRSASSSKPPSDAGSASSD